MRYFFEENESLVVSETYIEQVLWGEYRRQGWTTTTNFDAFMEELTNPEEEKPVFVEIDATNHEMLVHVLSEAEHLNCDEQWAIDELSCDALYTQILNLAL